MKTTSEAAFETAIETVLLGNGYVSHTSKAYDTALGIFPQVVLSFIQETQKPVWDKLEKLHGAKTGERVIAGLCKWMDTHGSLNTLRHGFKVYGKTLRIAFFKPAHGLNAELEARHSANVLGITRQLYFSAKRPKDSLDVVLSVNGVPIVTIELKNPMTGQTFANAIRQYRADRDHREVIFDFKKRTLAHFAVDTEEVYMTTRLAGSATHFLPFNRGNDGGAGNPVDPEGRNYKTAYLWEAILERQSLLDLLARFLHLQVENKRSDEGKRYKKEAMIFPRYHQLEAVRKLVTDSAVEGMGHNYLIEHSAGSGKSNTIGWLAHRLSNLHNTNEERVFDSVIVVTDRIVLDQQLQNTIYQFDHRQGVVQKIDENSRQLAEALENAVPIIITTLQKFPFVTKQLLKMAEERGDERSYLPTRKCAVIIDEAHSSQSGETATDLKEVLGGENLRKQAKQMAEEEEESELERMYRSMAKRGQQPNLSFYAFTATPKHKTLKVFGRAGKASSYYTMRQAIEEGFIEDVLKNYVTYKTYYKLLKSCKDDPNVERKKAARALSRYMRLHPHNISQKTAIMIEHFEHNSRHKIGGKAKAMVVTGSRLEAVRYKQTFDDYISEKGYAIKSLVAFSGTVQDDKIPEKTYTEIEMNGGVKEKDLPGEFGSDSYQVLLVAEKYQTGFDQPLLHTMYVDKRLSGIQAVQTLSRLNRTHPLKEDTFVLDFVNDPEEIKEAFKTYYDGATIGEEVEPERLYTIKAELDESGIYHYEEVHEFCSIFFAPRKRQSPNDHKLMNAIADKAVRRFKSLQESSDDEAEVLRGKLLAFKNLYSFLSQVIPYQDSDLERLYTFLKHLALKLPKRKSGPSYQFDDEVQLKYYRLQKISEGSISLIEGSAQALDGPKEVGSGVVREENVPLSRLIDVINSRFGENLTEADQLFFDQVREAAVQIDSIRAAAENNPIGKFKLVFGEILESLFIERMDLNEDIFARYMNDKEFKDTIQEWLGQEVYSSIPKQLKYVQKKPSNK